MISAPQTNAVLGKNIAISGGLPPFTKAEADQLAADLTTAPLPVWFTASVSSGG